MLLVSTGANAISGSYRVRRAKLTCGGAATDAVLSRVAGPTDAVGLTDPSGARVVPLEGVVSGTSRGFNSVRNSRTTWVYISYLETMFRLGVW